MLDIIKRIAGFFLDIIETIVIALAVFVVVYLFLFQPHQVKGNSMVPNFHDGEYILTDKITYRFRAPQRGEVIVFKSPRNQEIDFIKRIIGLPGEKVKLNNGDIFINGKKLTENYFLDPISTRPGSVFKEGQENLIPLNNYFVLGDNRSHSSDSREWGTVSVENIIGKAFLRYWPLNKIDLIKH